MLCTNRIIIVHILYITLYISLDMAVYLYMLLYLKKQPFSSNKTTTVANHTVSCDLWNVTPIQIASWNCPIWMLHGSYFCHLAPKYEILACPSQHVRSVRGYIGQPGIWWMTVAHGPIRGRVDRLLAVEYPIILSILEWCWQFIVMTI